jgi:alpha-ketoglutarate-dependent taurine dioxygenase
MSVMPEILAQTPAWPPVLAASAPGDLLIALGELRPRIEALLPLTGAVLLRGFAVPTIDTFRQFAAGFGHELLRYEFGSTPRAEVPAGGSGIYTSTEYPAHQSIPLHNEQSYTREWPMKIWFHCVTASAEGGATPIADSRAVLRRIPPSIRARFEPGVLYVRNFGGMDVPWQQVFNTQSRADVEAFCRRSHIEWQWQSDGGLRTRQLCQASAVHPRTGEQVWFNQAHLFHISARTAEERAVLLDLYGSENLPRNTYFADGSPIPDAMLDTVREAFDAESISFRWQDGDVLMLDNMLTAHGRAPFKGRRRVVVAMAEQHGSLRRQP